jgi:hypothetical protein
LFLRIDQEIGQDRERFDEEIMNNQALLNKQDVAESGQSRVSLDSSSEGLTFIRDLESAGRYYESQNETKCLVPTQSPHPANRQTESVLAGSNIGDNCLPFYGLKPVLPRRANPRRQDSFVSLQKWEGVVLAVEHDSFLARLIDLTQGGTEEEAEFSLDDISEEDKPLLKPGAIFYWNIGYHDSRTGQRRKVSEIRFRRLPAWTSKEIEAAKREAIRLRDLIGWM